MTTDFLEVEMHLGMISASIEIDRNALEVGRRALKDVRQVRVNP